MKLVRIDFIPAHILQATPSVYSPRNPLSGNAQRAGWRGFDFLISEVPAVGIEQIYPR